jgi:hypothetical protein
MKHASFPSAEIDSSALAVSGQTKKTKSLFALILEALHHSRRLQAQLVLWQYRHLVASPAEANSIPDPKSSIGGQQDVGH